MDNLDALGPLNLNTGNDSEEANNHQEGLELRSCLSNILPGRFQPNVT